MKKFNIFTVFLIILSISLIFLTPAASALTDPDTKADSALLVESGTEQVFYAKKSNNRATPGSITHVMTLLLAVESIEDGKTGLNDLVEASKTAAGVVNKKALTQNIAPGEMLTFEELMYCAYLAQASNACNIVAEHVSGSIDGFTEAMNKRAAKLGCTGTHYSNPDGTAAAGQYTTAWDQYLIFQEAISHTLFLRIAGIPIYKTEANGASPARTFEDSNLMVNGSSQYFYKSCIAGKTDNTDGASSSVACAKDRNMTLISVVLGAGAVTSDDGSVDLKSYTETKSLFEWGFSGYAWQTLVSNDEVATTVTVKLAKGSGNLGLRPSETITALLPTDLAEDEIRKDIVIYGQAEGKQPAAPIIQGEIMGEMTVYVDGVQHGKVKLLAAGDIALDKLSYIKIEILKTLSNLWVQLIIGGLLLIVTAYLALIIRDFIKRHKRKNMIKATKNRLIEERKKKRDEDQRLAEARDRVKTFKK